MKRKWLQKVEHFCNLSFQITIPTTILYLYILQFKKKIYKNAADKMDFLMRHNFIVNAFPPDFIICLFFPI